MISSCRWLDLAFLDSRSSHMHTAHFQKLPLRSPGISLEMSHRAPLPPKERLSHTESQPTDWRFGEASKRLATWGLNKMLLVGFKRKSLKHTRPKGASQCRKFLARISGCSGAGGFGSAWVPVTVSAGTGSNLWISCNDATSELSRSRIKSRMQRFSLEILNHRHHFRSWNGMPTILSLERIGCDTGKRFKARKARPATPPSLSMP
jgi:hypothetical protein